MKLSLKSTIVIWYTVWMLILLSSILALAAAAGDLVLIRKAESTLSEAIYDTEDEIREGDFGDIDYFDDGVYITLYSEDGNIISGRNPVPTTSKELYESTAEHINYQNQNWYVMDSSIRTEAGRVYIRAAYPFSGIAGLFGVNWYIFLIILPLIIILAAVGGYIIVSRSLKPLDKVVSTAEEISKGDDLEKRVTINSSQKEISHLTSAFNRMLSRLDEAFTREKQFTGDASHELRTPISVIKAESEYALDNITNSKKTEESLFAIKETAEQMNRTISQLLSLTRLEANRNIAKAEVNLSEIGEMVAETQRDEAAEKHITIHTDIEENVTLKGDETLLMRLMINLISNAISYGKQNGYVKLSIRKQENNAVIIIEDNGIGIKQQDIDKIFDRFYQADSSHSSKGAGLGLAMVKQITTIHSGNLTVQSTPEEGSVFTVTFPLK